MMKRPISCAAAVMIATSAMAQEQPNTILVLDGSGSMWGQIDGVAKITIAQDVVGELLGTIPDDQGLGLTVYGHRERGNCTDIETIVAPAPGTAGAIQDAVSGIKPLGKTPMTDAVIAAAQALRYTEDKATVILVSDGVETCNPDPCSAARLLEEAGIDFTAHVVGFDVGSDPEALAQMQCIAGETGGQFLTADNAGQLAEALTQVAAAPEPEPEPEPIIGEVTFEARLDTEDGPLIDTPLLWTLNPLPENVAAEEMGNELVFEMEQGSYEVTAYWLAQEVEQTKQFIATANPRTVVMVFETPAQTATVTAPETAPVGSTIEIGWNGPDEERDVIGVTEASVNDTSYVYRFSNSVRTDTGNPVSLLMPTTPGDYVIEYSLGATNERIGEQAIILTPVEASIFAPETVEAGSQIEVGWDGPGYDRDYIGITAADYEDTSYPYRFVTNTARLDDTRVAKLTAPTEPGSYVIEYAFGQDNSRLAAVPLEVVAVSASLTAPDSVEAGSTFEVSWSGPGYDRDYIGITAADAEDIGYVYRFATDIVRVSDGDVLNVRAPVEPGSYVLEYVINQDHSRLASVPLEVVDVQAGVTAPASVPAGSTFEVEWSGPGYERDYIGITAADAEDIGYVYRFATDIKRVSDSDGNTVRVRAPADPGQYIVEYVVNQDHSRLAFAPIEVTALSASVTAPNTAPAGSVIEVAWTGPGYERDYVGVTAADVEDIGYVYRFATTTKRVSEGDVLNVQLPTTPGDYVIEYVLDQDNSRLASSKIEVTPVTATLTAPSTGAAGSTIEVAWTGPAYSRDYIGVTAADYEDTNYPYRFSSDTLRVDGGDVLNIALPEEPGLYVIEYVFGLDNTRLVSVPITVN